MAEQRYRFGGPIPESVQRMKARRLARAVGVTPAEPIGIDTLGMPIFRAEAWSAATRSRPSPTAGGFPQP